MRRVFCEVCWREFVTERRSQCLCPKCVALYGRHCKGKNADHTSINACRVACGMEPLTEAEYRAYRKQAATWNRGRKVEAEA
jgi:hypothetical protein